MKMTISKTLTASLLATAVSFSALAEGAHHPAVDTPAPATQPRAPGGMPMMGGQAGMPMADHQGGMPMMGGQGDMPMMQMMQQRQTMMDQHMQKMEAHMASIESLLNQLVEQGKN